MIKKNTREYIANNISSIKRRRKTCRKRECKMNDDEQKNQLKELINLVLDSIDVAVTIIDTKGTLLYYNQHSAKIVDRKPEYIGTDIHSHHKKLCDAALQH
jgi:transcriptional regulator with PAS, ATPase and Fis domain